MLTARVSLLEIVDPDVAKRFIYAAGAGDVNLVVNMLHDGVPVDCFDEHGETALLWAAFNNHNDVANVLAKSGADVSWQDRYGNTPLIRAANRNNTDVMEVLLHHGADPSIVDVIGRTALDYARLRECEEAIQLLKKY